MDRKLCLWGHGSTWPAYWGLPCAYLPAHWLCVHRQYFIAWGLVMMNCGFHRYGRSDAKTAALCALVFGGMYAAAIPLFTLPK